MKFSGKVALVTGSGQGIGEGYAKGLAAHGCRVAVADVNETQGARVVQEIKQAGGEAMFVKVDVGSEESANAAAKTVQQAWGGIDYLVNNAAIFGNLEFSPLLSVDMNYL